MRKNIVAGNWKMNTTVGEGIDLANEVSELLSQKGSKNCEVILCVPFTHLVPVVGVTADAPLYVGAEDCSAHDKGAYTGEVSAAMVASTGADYCIIGHSERRQYHGENGPVLNAKVHQALANKLQPIFCVGEVLEERENGTYFDVVTSQLEDLFDLTPEEFGQVVLAYEPVWAIGTGKTATADQAQEMHAHIRKVVAEKYGKEVADNCSILYGGSCKPENAREIFSKPDVDGGLIGGAALKAPSFMGIIEAFD